MLQIICIVYAFISGDEPLAPTREAREYHPNEQNCKINIYINGILSKTFVITISILKYLYLSNGALYVSNDRSVGII